MNYVIKSDGTREPFDVSKLESSLQKSGASDTVVSKVVERISEHLPQGVTTHEIYKHAFDLLHKEEKPAAFRYSLPRAIMELGPSGFPFEDYVAEIFKFKGFQTETDKIVRGFCVEHEIDVIAWNEKKLIMCEAKFHNELGAKSDLKVALYVKARFEDLQKMKFNYGGERDLNEGWLITNTKFTSAAIEYGSCQGGMFMVGWNYPPIGNLHDMIVEARLHPITCLTTLNGMEKKILLGQKVVLCKTLEETPELLQNIRDKEKVLDEIKAL